MKKRNIVIIIIIWILSLIGIFIYSKTKKELPNQEIIEPVIEEETLDKYEYIDYTGYYDENDLKIEEKYTDDGKNYSYIEISGLKDKNIEEKINKRLYDELQEKESFRYINSRVTYNANNILSGYITKYKEEEQINETFNIDLTTGEELKLEDILNTTNITGEIANAYYDAASYIIGGKIKRIESDILMYQSCIERNSNCDDMYNSIKDSELKKQEYENDLNQIEEYMIKFARSFDKNQKFYITSAGIIFPRINIYKDNYSNLMLTVKHNPRLFNYFYKYNKESIFDGTYTGKKNLIMAEYNQYGYNESMVKQIDDYAIISYEDELIFEKNILDNYLTTLDKNKFTYIYNTYESDYDNRRYINLTQCTMTKELYKNTVKKELADAILKSTHTQGHYSIKNENATCENIQIYEDNTSVIFSNKTKTFTVIDNEEKTKEVNEELNEILKEFAEENSTYFTVKNITEEEIILEITSYDRVTYNSKKIIERINLKES